MDLGSSTNTIDGGQTVIVTGAGGGIGLSIVQGLLAHKLVNLVVGVDLVTTELEKLQEEAGERLKIVSGDVSERGVNQKAINQAIKYTGRLGSIILNAGILRPVGHVATIDIEEWKRLIDVNFISLLHAIQIALPHLRENHGNVIMTSSGVATRPWPAWIPYACSKASMNCLASCLSAEEKDVSFICVTPGIVDTGIQQQVRVSEKANLPPEQYAWLDGLHKSKKLLDPTEPARTFVKLALNGIPGGMNGQVLAWDDNRMVD